MTRFIPKDAALQVTEAQCRECAERSLVAVLVKEFRGGYGPDRDRAFYLCERCVDGYVVHTCGIDAPLRAAA